jgi:hypothetical protein
MAKLTAHGRTEQARCEKEEIDGNKRTVTQAVLCSDNVILRKTTWFVNGRRDFGTGWQVASRHYKGTVDEWVSSLSPFGYVRA